MKIKKVKKMIDKIYVHEYNNYCSVEKQEHARVAQWWSIALPRRGSRVRIPSRAFFVSKNNIDCFLLMRYTFAKGVNLFT